MTPEARAHAVKRAALDLGFAAVGISGLNPISHGDVLERWLGNGMAGTMTYMHRQLSRRREPAGIVPGALRAVVVTRTYSIADPPRQPGTGRVAKYARGEDYHDALQQPLRQLGDRIRALGGSRTIVRWYVDAGPVPERELAQRAGIGWIGKNTMLIDPRRGSYCFLATVFTDLDIAVDPPFEADRCGTCRRCLDACPTGAFPTERVLDSRRCISYLTIEHRGDIAPELQELMGEWLFGCDVCQDVCPWNHKFATEPMDPELVLDPTLAELDLEALTHLSDAEFQRRFGHTALTRTGAAGIRRNAQIAVANAGGRQQDAQIGHRHGS